MIIFGMPDPMLTFNPLSCPHPALQKRQSLDPEEPTGNPLLEQVISTGCYFLFPAYPATRFHGKLVTRCSEPCCRRLSTVDLNG